MRLNLLHPNTLNKYASQRKVKMIKLSASIYSFIGRRSGEKDHNMGQVLNKQKQNIKLTFLVLFVFLSLWAGVEFSHGFGAMNGSSKTSPILQNASKGKFSVLTYNIAGLPQIISSAKTERAESIADIGQKLNQYDIVHVQEDFNYNDNLYENGNLHPFRSSTKGGVPFGDGLNTLSKYPVTDIRRIPWEACTGADCLTPKGFSYSRIEVAKNVFIDFYNVHANAFNHLEAAAARRQNIQQLSAYIKAHSFGNAVVVMGDLNAHYSFSYDNIRELLAENHLEDSWIFLKHNGDFPISVMQLPDNDILKLDDQSETIDKILYRSSSQIQLNPSDYNLEKYLFTNVKGMPLSDHNPVSVTFTWSLENTIPEMSAAIDGIQE